MVKPNFVVKPAAGGRTKYLLLTLAPPLILLYLLRHLIQSGVIPNENGMATMLYLIPLAGIWVLSYLLIYRKNHSIAVFDDHLVETNWRGKEKEISLSSIRSVKTNAFGEGLLKDESGKTLLCIESNMENRDLLENWLTSHAIS